MTFFFLFKAVMRVTCFIHPWDIMRRFIAPRRAKISRNYSKSKELHHADWAPLAQSSSVSSSSYTWGEIQDNKILHGPNLQSTDSLVLAGLHRFDMYAHTVGDVWEADAALHRCPCWSKRISRYTGGLKHASNVARAWPFATLIVILNLNHVW